MAFEESEQNTCSNPKCKSPLHRLWTKCQRCGQKILTQSEIVKALEEAKRKVKEFKINDKDPQRPN